LGENSSEDTGGGASTPKPHSIGPEIDLFVRQIDSLAETLPGAIRVIQTLNRSSGQEYGSFLEQECKVPGKDGEAATYRVDGITYFKYRRLLGRVQKGNLAGQLYLARF
jgi:hypothetical protein